MSKIKVAVLGATGAVGQRFVQLLENHPWFEVRALTGSDRSVGQVYAKFAAGCWTCRCRITRDHEGRAHRTRLRCGVGFSALPADQAKAIEPTFAQAGHGVCSNASSYRMEEDVPLLIPEVNPDHTR